MTDVCFSPKSFCTQPPANPQKLVNPQPTTRHPTYFTKILTLVFDLFGEK
eukprot:UN02924